tara:strand:+ start:136 stop:618 length:483 start_codon:yes stop_codon:yes gene_type:complete
MTMNAPPVDTNDREQRESRPVPFDNDPNSLWTLAAAGMITSVDVDKRGILSPAESPNEAESSALPPTRFGKQTPPFSNRPTTPPPPPPPPSPPWAPKKPKRAPLAEVYHQVMAAEIKQLEKENAVLANDKDYFKKLSDLQANVVEDLFQLTIFGQENRAP